MSDPKTLEEAIQIIKSLKRCGICKHRKKYPISESHFFFYCQKEHVEHWPTSERHFEVKDSNSCEHWE